MAIKPYYKLLSILYIFTIFTVLLGQLGSIPVGGSIGIYASDIAVSLLVVVWIGSLRAHNFKRMFMLHEVLLFMFLAVALVSLINSMVSVSSDIFIVGVSYWARLVFYSLLLPIEYDIWKFTKKDHFWSLALAVTAFGVLGILQFLLFPDFSQFVEHGWDPHYYRVLSTFFDPNFAGLWLSFGVLFVLDRWYTASNTRLQKNIIYLFVSILLIALVLTFSRSTYLAFGIGLTVFSFIRDKRILIVMGIFGLLAFTFIPRVQTRIIGALTIDETASYRIDDYQKTLGIVVDHPLLGVGYNTFRNAQFEYGYFRNGRGVNDDGGHAGAGADNSFLFTLATMGIVGLLSLLIFGLSLFSAVKKSSQNAYLLSSLVAFIIHAQFVNSLYYTWMLAWFLGTTGLYLKISTYHEA